MVAVDRISQHRRWRDDALGQSLTNQLQGDLGFGLEPHVGRNARRAQAGIVVAPGLRKIKPPGRRQRGVAVGYHQLDAHLAVRLLADRAAILMLHAHRMRALLDPSGFVDHPVFRHAQYRQDVASQSASDRVLVPGTVRQKLLQPLNVNPQTARHRLHRLAMSGQQ